MTTYPTLSADRHSLLCVSEVLAHVIRGDGQNISGAAELADKALREVIDRMGAAEDDDAVPGAKMPGGGVYRDEPADWRGRLWSWGDTLDGCLNWLGEVSQTLELVESRIGNDGSHGPVALAHDRLLEAMGEIRKLQAEVSLFYDGDDAPVVGGSGDDATLASFADAVENCRKAEALARRLDGGEDEAERAAWDMHSEAFDAAMHYPVTTAEELRAKVALFRDYHLSDRFAENMSQGICDQIEAVFSDGLRLAEQPAPVNYGILQDRIAKLEAVAAQPGLDRAYRLACDLGNSLDTIRDVRHSLVALSMVDGLEDWQRGAVDLAFRSLDRELEAIDDLTDPIAIDWREANGLRPEGGLPDSASEQEDA